MIRDDPWLADIDEQLDREYRRADYDPPGWLVAVMAVAGVALLCGLIYGCIRLAVLIGGG